MKKDIPLSVYMVKPCCLHDFCKQELTNSLKGSSQEQNLFRGASPAWPRSCGTQECLFLEHFRFAHWTLCSEQARWEYLHHSGLRGQPDKCLQIRGLAPSMLCISFVWCRDEGSPCQSWFNNSIAWSFQDIHSSREASTPGHVRTNKLGMQDIFDRIVSVFISSFSTW